MSTRSSILSARAAVIRALRATLDGRGFIEVQTPLLVAGTFPDRGIEPVRAGEEYLVSSTEYQLKRLYAEGIPAAYTLGANFRAGDHGQWHNPEFTMLEWGRAGATMSEVEHEAEALVHAAGAAAGVAVPRVWARVTVRALLANRFGVEIGDWSELSRIPGPLSADADAHVSWLVDTALSSLDREVPTWVVGWPAHMTASAGLDPTDPTTTLRSEIFWRGLELADGFPFCNDADWQRDRTRAENAARVRSGQAEVAEDARFLEAVQRLPMGAGMAMGVDRLCAALLQAGSLAEVMTFSWTDR
jgi:lysyl-tRNA synthetase class 2